MKKFLLAVLFAPLAALAQTYPSPTFNSVTLQNPLTAANGGTGVTTSTGSGSVVLSTSATLSGPTLSNPVVTGTSTIPYSLTFNNPAATTVAGKLNQIVNFTDFGPTCNGSTLDQTAWNTAISTIGSTPTTLIVSCPSKINAALTFSPNTQLWFQGNGEIIGTAGTELVQVQQQIIAGRTQIFSNLVAQADIGMTDYPEWWGGNQAVADASAGFNNAYGFLKNVGGVISAAAGTYSLQNPINNVKSHVTLRGAGQGATLLNVTATNINGIVAQGTSGSPLASPVFEAFDIQSTAAGTTNTGILLQYTALARLSNIQVSNFFQSVYMQRATNTFFYKMGGALPATNGAICWVIDGGGTGTGGNASSTWRDTYCQGTATAAGGGGNTGQIGYKAFGAYVSDLYFSNASSAETNYGRYYDYSTATAGGYADVIDENPVIDGFTAQAIFINAMPAQQMITITDGWLNPVSMLAETDSIYITGSSGHVRINGTQIGGEANYAYAVGIRVINSSQVKVSGVSLQDNKYAIQESGSTGNTYIGNSVSNTSAHAGSVDFFLTGSSGAIVSNNTLNGYSSFGIQADATSNSVQVTGNTVNGGNITTPVQNNGSNPIGGGYTGTGLNVLQTSPTFITPNLGTPSAVMLTNGTGLPISTGVSGLGTGVATALGSAVAGSGGPVLATSPTITTPVINGVTNGSAAASGQVGQTVTNSTTGTAITSGTTVNATSVSVPAGDWNCWGNATFTPTASTSVANIAAGLTTTSATLPASPNTTYLGTTLTTGTNGTTSLNPTMLVENVSTSTPLYLVAEAASVTGGSGATVNGYITCRRMH